MSFAQEWFFLTFGLLLAIGLVGMWFERRGAAPALVGGNEWMHDLGFGDLDGEEGVGEGQAPVRRAQPQAAEAFDADDPHAGSAPEVPPGAATAYEGGFES